jgi:hypothetical protein
MVKKTIIATIYSFIAFCVVSYISIMNSLLNSAGNLSKQPVANLGFPFKYYYQFWLSGSDSPNCGWNFTYFIYDCLIIWIITISVYFLVRKR